jgi:hypothetical protein
VLDFLQIAKAELWLSLPAPWRILETQVGALTLPSKAETFRFVG